MPERDEWNRKIIEEFRANSGHVGGPFEGIPILLLHHKGAKTGTERVNPLAFRRDAGAYVVFASKGGAPTSPDWYHNLLANPRVSIEVGTDAVEVKARVALADERDRLWSAQKQDVPAFAEYERSTAREIPVVVLDPVG